MGKKNRKNAGDADCATHDRAWKQTMAKFSVQEKAPFVYLGAFSVIVN